MTASDWPEPTPFFYQAGAKISIGSLDEPNQWNVVAQYNPKELEIKKTIPWTPHKKANADGLQQEYTGGAPRTISVDFMFDGYEENESVQPMIDKLETLATVCESSSKDPQKRRPHHCVLVWGKLLSENKFQCIIESISTKYQMFSDDGVPLRATVTLTLKEADRVSMSKKLGPQG